MTPVFQTSTYVQESPAKHKGYAYARGANPTRNALQKSIAAMRSLPRISPKIGSRSRSSTFFHVFGSAAMT